MRRKKSNILEWKTTGDLTGLPCWENVCVNAVREVWPSALDPTDSVCGVSLGMILDYGCNNPRHPLGNMLIAQIGNFSTPHSQTKENKPNLVSIPDPDYRIRLLDMVLNSCCQNSKPGIFGTRLVCTRPQMHRTSERVATIEFRIKRTVHAKWTLCHHLLTRMLFQIGF